MLHLDSQGFQRFNFWNPFFFASFLPARWLKKGRFINTHQPIPLNPRLKKTTYKLNCKWLIQRIGETGLIDHPSPFCIKQSILI